MEVHVMYKFLFKFIILPILVILAIPATLLLLMYNKTEVPVEDYHASVNLMNEITTTLDQELEDIRVDTTKESVVVTFNAQAINRSIGEALMAQSEAYQNPDYEGTKAFDYVVLIDEYVGIKGAWVSFGKDTLTLNARADVFVTESITYTTTLKVIFEIKMTDSEFSLSLKGVRLGHLPIPVRLSATILDFVLGQMDSFDLNEMVEQVLPMGEFSLKDIKYTLSFDEIVTLAEENQPLFGVMMDLVLSNRLMDFALTKEGFQGAIHFGKLRSDGTITVPAYLDESVMANFDQQAVIEQRVSAFLLNALSGERKLKLDEKTVNQLLYHNVGNTLTFSQDVEFEVNDETKIYTVAIKGTFIRMEGNELKLYAVFDLAGLEAVLEIQTEVSTREDGYIVLSVQAITMGEVVINADMIETLFTLFDDAFETEGNAILVSMDALESLFLGSDLRINGLSIASGQLVIDVEVDNALADAFDDLIEELQNAIDQTLNDPALETLFMDNLELETQLQDVLDQALNGTITEESIEEFLETLQGLDEADQQLLIDTLLGHIDEATLNQFFEAFNNN